MPTKLDYIHDHFVPKKGLIRASDYPVISNVQATTAGLITWTTDIPSTSQVFYGTVPYLGFQTAQNPTLVTSHSVQLPGLNSGTLYYFKVASFYFDSLSISDLYTFIFSSGDSILLENGINYLVLEDGTRIALE